LRAISASLELLAVTALLCGCATNSSHLATGFAAASAGAVELSDTPFFPQTENLCGPAALATVLNQSGVPVDTDTLTSAVYLPERKGTLQLELITATRGYSRVPYPIHPTFTSLVAELHAGRPVLVLQNLGFDFAPIWHYAVVIGYLPDQKRVVLRSGDVERYVMSERKFLKAWERGDFWGMVVLRPGELPADTEEGRYLRAVAAFETIGDYDAAMRSYEAASRRWPDSKLALLGLGNTRYAQGALEDAERAYRRVLDHDPRDAIALNNLAQTLADRGCVREAAVTIERALVADPSLAPLLETQALIARLPQTTCSG